jgi:hypothetical protein
MVVSHGACFTPHQSADSHYKVQALILEISFMLMSRASRYLLPVCAALLLFAVILPTGLTAYNEA